MKCLMLKVLHIISDIQILYFNQESLVGLHMARLHFTYYSTHLWNLLSNDIRRSTEITTFKNIGNYVWYSVTHHTGKYVVTLDRFIALYILMYSHHKKLLVASVYVLNFDVKVICIPILILMFPPSAMNIF